MSRTIVITGGTSGIGLATAKRFLNLGENVVVTARRQEAIDEYNASLSEDEKSRSLTVLADAANLQANQDLFNQVKERFGGVDVLFLNAGIAPMIPFDQTNEDTFDSVFNINVKGPYFTTQAAIPHLNEGSTVIYNTSVVNVKGFPNLSAYSASKAALRSVVRSLATELAPKGIRVNAVAPGPIETPIYGKMNLSPEEVEQLGAGFAQQVPLGRFGAADEIADAVVYLGSNTASYITGNEIAVDGGLSMV